LLLGVAALPEPTKRSKVVDGLRSAHPLLCADAGHPQERAAGARAIGGWQIILGAPLCGTKLRDILKKRSKIS